MPPSAIAAREAEAAGLCAGASHAPQCAGLLDPGAGDLWNIQAGTTFQPSGALRTSLDLTKQRLVRDDTNGVAFDETILTSRTTYQFTRFTFARARRLFGSQLARAGSFCWATRRTPAPLFT